jgi:uncharacterized damage-inducible protein DinB
MEPFAADALDIIKTCHDGLRNAVKNADPQALNWLPGPEMNSISILVIHVLGSERFWLGQAVGMNLERDRDAEFQSNTDDPSPILRHIDEADAEAASVLTGFSAADANRQLPFQDRKVSGMWAVMHVIEHLREHLGHTELTLQLWAQQKATV